MDFDIQAVPDFIRANSWVLPGVLAVLVLSAYWLYDSALEGGLPVFRGLRSRLGVSRQAWSSLSEGQREMVKDISESCRRNGVRLVLSESERLDYPDSGNKVSGYFSDSGEDEGPILKVAIGRDADEWVQVLLHESSHMDQWSERSYAWEMCVMDGRDVYETFMDWLDGKRACSDYEIERVVRRCMEVEYDCERRTVAKLEKYGMDGKIDEYIQKSNSYIWSYYVMRIKRRWYSVPPYSVRSLWERMPKRFLEFDEYFRMDWETLTSFTKFCFNVNGAEKERRGV